MDKAILLNEKDNVVTVLKDMNKDEELSIYNMENEFLEKIKIKEHIPYGNKLATKDIADKENIIKYGEKMGLAIRPIEKGTLAHVHNIESYNIEIPESVKTEVMEQMNIK